MNSRLGVNIDHIATLRNLRDTPYPSIVQAAQLCIRGGADQITIHLREDRRHIRDKDLFQLKKEMTVDLNLEIAATPEMLGIALELQPHSICIVPEKRQERTTEGGLDLSHQSEFLNEICIKAKKQNILVSFFIEPDINDILRSKELGAPAVELHTGSLCIAFQKKDTNQLDFQWNRFKQAVAQSNEIGLFTHAGHGIDYESAKDFAKIGGVLEYNIGHSIVCESVFCGLEEATRKMKKAIVNG